MINNNSIYFVQGNPDWDHIGVPVFAFELTKNYASQSSTLTITSTVGTCTGMSRWENQWFTEKTGNFDIFRFVFTFLIITRNKL